MKPTREKVAPGLYVEPGRTEIRDDGTCVIEFELKIVKWRFYWEIFVLLVSQWRRSLR